VISHAYNRRVVGGPLPPRQLLPASIPHTKVVELSTAAAGDCHRGAILESGWRAPAMPQHRPPAQHTRSSPATGACVGRVGGHGLLLRRPARPSVLSAAPDADELQVVAPASCNRDAGVLWGERLAARIYDRLVVSEFYQAVVPMAVGAENGESVGSHPDSVDRAVVTRNV